MDNWSSVIIGISSIIMGILSIVITIISSILSVVISALVAVMISGAFVFWQRSRPNISFHDEGGGAVTCRVSNLPNTGFFKWIPRNVIMRLTAKVNITDPSIIDPLENEVILGDRIEDMNVHTIRLNDDRPARFKAVILPPSSELHAEIVIAYVEDDSVWILDNDEKPRYKVEDDKMYDVAIGIVADGKFFPVHNTFKIRHLDKHLIVQWVGEHAKT